MEGSSLRARWLSVIGAVFVPVAAALAGVGDTLYVSPAGHNFRADGMPLHTADDVQASLELARSLGVKRVYWRGFQEDYLMRHAVVRKENFQLAEYWDWMRETAGKRGIHKAALGVEGIEFWGVFGLFDLGSDPREDAYCGAAAGYGPAVYEDSLRLQYPGEVPLDLKGIRRECGPIRFRDPEVRRELIDRLMAELEKGYTGLLLYTYAENLSLWFPGEFGVPVPPGEVETFLRELKTAMQGKKLGLQVDAREAFRDRPSPWLGLTPDTNTVGDIRIAWEKWVGEGLLDEVVFSVAPGSGESAVALCTAMTEKYPAARFSLLARTEMPPESPCRLILDARSTAFREKFVTAAKSVDLLKPWAEGSLGRVPKLEEMQGSAAITAGLGAMAKGDPEDSGWLMAMVKTQPVFPVRQQAADTLAAWDAKNAIIALAEDSDAAVRRVAYSAATKMKSLDAARVVLNKALTDADAYNRWVGFRGLGRYPLDEEAVLKGLADSDPTVRSEAAWLVRPGQKVGAELRQALQHRFITLHDEPHWNWEYRTVGDALMNAGPEGRSFLEKCLADSENRPRVADSAWRCLFIPQTGAGLKLSTGDEAAHAYEAYPKGLLGKTPRLDP